VWRRLAADQPPREDQPAHTRSFAAHRIASGRLEWRRSPSGAQMMSAYAWGRTCTVAHTMGQRFAQFVMHSHIDISPKCGPTLVLPRALRVRLALLTSSGQARACMAAQTLAQTHRHRHTPGALISVRPIPKARPS